MSGFSMCCACGTLVLFKKYEEMVCGKREWNRSGGKVYGKEQSVILRDKEVEKNFWGGILWS